MKCIVDGFPIPGVNWTKNGALHPYVGNMITINHTSFDDEGQYECSAENWVGKISKTVWIDVTGNCCDTISLRVCHLKLLAIKHKAGKSAKETTASEKLATITYANVYRQCTLTL